MKRIPLILLCLFLFAVAWVVSPFWANHLPFSTQKTLASSTKMATKVYDWMSSAGKRKSTFRPGHYTGIPKGASFIANFSVSDNVDKNMIDHPKLKLNGNVITPPKQDKKDQFQIQYPGSKATHPSVVSEAKWVAYLEAHPHMFVQVSQATGKMNVWLMADQQWWTKQLSGKVDLSKNTTITQGSSSSPDDIGAKLSGDQGFTVPEH